MGGSWQTVDQKAFIGGFLPSYVQHSTSKTARTLFWPDFLEKWFKAWPLPDPSPESVGEGETVQRVMEANCGKKIAQLKRVFKTASSGNAVGGRRDLRLEAPPPRRRSELQAYMVLYYGTRIRPAVLKQWEGKTIDMDFSRSEPEEEPDPEDNSSKIDPKIPICFKNQVARQLYDVEEEEIKELVRSKRDADVLIKTVYNASLEDRAELVREQHLNVSSMGKNITNVLGNLGRKCSAKGIVWVASPTPALGGQPVGHFKCGGVNPDGQDFEAFIGAEKTKEFKLLFSRWIHQIYPPSDWALFANSTSAASTSTTSGTADCLDLTSSMPGPAVSGPAAKLPASSLAPGQSTPILVPDSSTVPIAPNYIVPTLVPDPPVPSPTLDSLTLTLAPGPPTLSFAPSAFTPTPVSSTLVPALTAEWSTPSLVPEWSSSSLVPELFTQSPLSEPSAPPNDYNAAPDKSSATQTIIVPDDLDLMRTQTIHSFDQSGAISNSLLPQPAVFTTMLMAPESNLGYLTPAPDPVQLPSGERISHTNHDPTLTSLTGITDEPAWMKKKRTLDYFRGASKLGDLPNVIAHWYELERRLGFQDITLAGFPTSKRPEVVRLFHKNAHNYRKNYNVEAHTLGCKIMEWWSEICSGKVPSARLGGPTGIYTFVVLMTWWCRLLEVKPVGERADCLHVLGDFDRFLLTAISEVGGNSAVSTSTLLSPTSLPLPSQSRK